MKRNEIELQNRLDRIEELCNYFISTELYSIESFSYIIRIAKGVSH